MTMSQSSVSWRRTVSIACRRRSFDARRKEDQNQASHGTPKGDRVARSAGSGSLEGPEKEADAQADPAKDRAESRSSARLAMNHASQMSSSRGARVRHREVHEVEPARHSPLGKCLRWDELQVPGSDEMSPSPTEQPPLDRNWIRVAKIAISRDEADQDSSQHRRGIRNGLEDLPKCAAS